MAARKAKAYQVIGAAAVIRKDKHERYVGRGAVFAIDALDEENAQHLLSVGLIAAYEIPEPDEGDAEAEKAAEAAKAAAK